MGIKNTLNKYLRRIGVELHGINYLKALSKGYFKSSEIDVIKRFYRDSKIVIYDVGANRGLMIEEYLKHFPLCNIHAFEAYPQYAETLNLQYEKFENVTINKFGISNTEDQLALNVNKSIDTSSFLSSQKTGLNSDSQVQTETIVRVPVTTLETYSKSNNHEKIHLLKLDIQGSELNALKGAEILLRENRIDFIFCETYFIQQYLMQPSFFDISNYLLSFGYVLQDIYNPIYGHGKMAWCDVLFVNKNLTLH